MSFGVHEDSCVEYSSNNSGGSWWLSDKDWEALEEAGWKVMWLVDDEYFKNQLDENGRWLGAKAKMARRYGVPVEIALAEFTVITGQSPYSEGCSCCGQPHKFYQYDENEELIW